MDEPTNDLDSETLELLEERVVDYEGTLIVVSHDREFLNNCVTSMLVFENGAIKEYVGGYDDWLRQRKKPESQASQKKSDSKSNASSNKEEVKEAGKKLSYKEKLELEKLPLLIEEMEAEIGRIHDEMSNPEYFRGPADKQTKDQKRISELEGKLPISYARWEELSERDQ
jgi:ATP-binding cassette subfamily F protein uup